MKKLTGFKQGYYIKIIDGFYEVISGNRCVYFGECRKNSTIQEIANKTFLLEQEDTDVRLRRIKRNVGCRRGNRESRRNPINARENVTCV